jgi:hypothetical protein
MIKQYVNLPINHDENEGIRLNLEVEAEDLSDEDIARAEWWVDPVGSDNQDQKYLSRSARARLRWNNTRNRRDKFRNIVTLPHVGGDRYVVKCSKHGDRSSPVELEEIQTWRKLYYTVHYMNNDCRDFFNDLKNKFETAFEESFIELENVTMNQTLVDEPHTRSTNSLNHLYRRRPRLSNRPFHLRLVVLNNIYDPESNEYEETTTDGVYVHATDEGLDPRRPIISVRAKRSDRRSWISVTRHASKTGDSEITVRLEDDARIKRALDDGHDITVKIRTRERDEYLGHSIGNFCCVRINESGTLAQRKITVLQTLTHEVGHGCQQVVKRERTYNAAGSATGWENNPKWHTDNFGGQGPHCWTNAKVAASTSTSSGSTYVWDSGTLCTMFFRDDSHVDADGKFCDECKPRLCRVNLGARQMRRKGWGRY